MSEEEYANYNYKRYPWLYTPNNNKYWTTYINDFYNLGVAIAGIELPFDASGNLGNIEYGNISSFQNLLFGFPSIKIPSESDYVYWRLNGNYFGSEHVTSGQFTADNILENVDEEEYSIDGGPIMICHKNGKDVIIISAFSSRSFQRFQNNRFGWNDYYSSPMEQSVRIKDKGDQVTLEFGLGESFRNFDEAKDHRLFQDGSDQPKLSIEKVMSETIFVASDKGANAAIEKFGKMIEIFGNLPSSDCPCDELCSNKRGKNLEKMKYVKYLSYSFEKESFYNFNLGKFNNYDQVLDNVYKTFAKDDSNQIQIGKYVYVIRIRLRIPRISQYYVI